MVDSPGRGRSPGKERWKGVAPAKPIKEAPAPRRARRDTREPSWTRVFFPIVAVVFLLGVVGLILWRVWNGEEGPGNRVLIAVKIDGYPAPFPPNAFAANDYALLKSSPMFRASEERQTSERLGNLASDLHQLPAGLETLIVYVSAHGVAVDGPPRLILPDSSPRDLNGERLGTLLDGIAASEAKHKLLLLDGSRLRAFADLGLEGNDFSKALEENLKARDPTSVKGASFWVLSASRSGEPSLVSWADEYSLFGLATSYALKGGVEADADQDGTISASELHQFVEKTLTSRSGGGQVPSLVRVRGEEDFPIVATNRDSIPFAQWGRPAATAAEPAAAETPPEAKESEPPKDDKTATEKPAELKQPAVTVDSLRLQLDAHWQTREKFIVPPDPKDKSPPPARVPWLRPDHWATITNRLGWAELYLRDGRLDLAESLVTHGIPEAFQAVKDNQPKKDDWSLALAPEKDPTAEAIAKSLADPKKLRELRPSLDQIEKVEPAFLNLLLERFVQGDKWRDSDLVAKWYAVRLEGELVAGSVLGLSVHDLGGPLEEVDDARRDGEQALLLGDASRAASLFDSAHARYTKLRESADEIRRLEDRLALLLSNLPATLRWLMADPLARRDALREFKALLNALPTFAENPSEASLRQVLEDSGDALTSAVLRSGVETQARRAAKLALPFVTPAQRREWFDSIRNKDSTLPLYISAESAGDSPLEMYVGTLEPLLSEAGSDAKGPRARWWALFSATTGANRSKGSPVRRRVAYPLLAGFRNYSEPPNDPAFESIARAWEESRSAALAKRLLDDEKGLPAGQRKGVFVDVREKLGDQDRRPQCGYQIESTKLVVQDSSVALPVVGTASQESTATLFWDAALMTVTAVEPVAATTSPGRLVFRLGKATNPTLKLNVAPKSVAPKDGAMAKPVLGVMLEADSVTDWWWLPVEFSSRAQEPVVIDFPGVSGDNIRLYPNETIPFVMTVRKTSADPAPLPVLVDLLSGEKASVAMQLTPLPAPLVDPKLSLRLDGQKLTVVVHSLAGAELARREVSIGLLPPTELVHASEEVVGNELTVSVKPSIGLERPLSLSLESFDPLGERIAKADGKVKDAEVPLKVGLPPFAKSGLVAALSVQSVRHAIRFDQFGGVVRRSSNAFIQIDAPKREEVFLAENRKELRVQLLVDFPFRSAAGEDQRDLNLVDVNAGVALPDGAATRQRLDRQVDGRYPLGRDTEIQLTGGDKGLQIVSTMKSPELVLSVDGLRGHFDVVGQAKQGDAAPVMDRHRVHFVERDGLEFRIVEPEFEHKLDRNRPLAVAVRFDAHSASMFRSIRAGIDKDHNEKLAKEESALPPNQVPKVDGDHVFRFSVKEDPKLPEGPHRLIVEADIQAIDAEGKAVLLTRSDSTSVLLPKMAPPSKTGALKVEVVLVDGAVDGEATVTVTDSAQKVHKGKAGQAFENLPEGKCKIEAVGRGERKGSIDDEVKAGQTKNVTVKIQLNLGP